MEVRNPEQIIEPIETGELLEKVMELKHKGYRLSQTTSSYVDGKYELSYSFADDDTNLYHTLRLVVDPDVEVPSITEIIPAASFYENEMREMYGVKIQWIDLDLKNRLYRIDAVAPLKVDRPKKGAKK